MPIYCPIALPERFRRTAMVVLAIVSATISAEGQAQQLILKSPSPAPAEPASPTTTEEMSLTPPINSTLEIRVARRPWLLEKLSGSKKEKSVKMTPPSPPGPIADPPSLRTPNLVKPDGWRRRTGANPNSNTQPTHADLGQQPAVDTPPMLDTPSGAKPSQAKPSEARPSEANATGDATKPGENASTEPGAEAVPAGGSASEPQPAATAAPPVEGDAEETPEAQSKNNPDTNTEAESEGEIQPPAPSDTRKVRELRIEVDGTPIDASAPSPSDEKPGRVSDGVVTEVESSDARSASQRDTRSSQRDNERASSASGRVGDVDPAPVRTVIDLDYTGRPKQRLALGRTVRSMQNMMRATLRYYYARPENANERSNWGVMHSMMVYGTDTKVRAGARTYNAIAWIAGNNPCRGQKLLSLEDGFIVARSGVGLQGHQAQLLAILALCDVPFDYTLYAGDERFTVGDLIESEMLACRSGEELTFTLIGLAHYLDTDIVWRNEDGELWDFERLLREELAQPIVGAACGGTHRLMGYAHALRKRRAEGKPISGQWRRAEIYTNDFVQYAYRLQNRDGSMTTDWFEGREDNGDLDRKIQTTGHMIEWLLTLTPDSQLQDRRLVSAVRFLMKSLYEERGREWKIGPKGHALRSLAMYYERAYRSGPAWRTPSVARKPQSQR